MAFSDNLYSLKRFYVRMRAYLSLFEICPRYEALAGKSIYNNTMMCVYLPTELFITQKQIHTVQRSEYKQRSLFLRVMFLHVLVQKRVYMDIREGVDGLRQATRAYVYSAVEQII